MSASTRKCRVATFHYLGNRKQSLISAAGCKDIAFKEAWSLPSAVQIWKYTVYSSTSITHLPTKAYHHSVTSIQNKYIECRARLEIQATALTPLPSLALEMASTSPSLSSIPRTLQESHACARIGGIPQHCRKGAGCPVPC